MVKKQKTFLKVWQDSDDEDLGLLYESIRIEQNKRIRNELLNARRNGSVKRKNSLKKAMSKFRGQLDKELMDYRAQKNPFLSYGIGIQNYFNLQVLIIKLLCLICILTIPQMIIYASMDGTGSKFKDQSPTSWLMQKISFGNMGYSKAICSSVYVDWSDPSAETTLNFSCQRTTKIERVISAGVSAA